MSTGLSQTGGKKDFDSMVEDFMFHSGMSQRQAEQAARNVLKEESKE